jgi:hypothetical protein
MHAGKWVDKGNPISLREIEAYELQLEVSFPQTFKNFILDHDGGTPSASSFQYYDASRGYKLGSDIGAFIPFKENEYNSIASIYLDPPEFFPEGLIAFAETGNGDFICFDYRETKKNLDPSIVYWNHEADSGKDISFVAKNFAGFLDMVEEPKEEA